VTRAQLLELGKWPAQHVVELAAGAALVMVGLLVWRLAWPGSFARVVSRPLRGVWRGWWVYRLGWAKSMWLCGLAVRDRPTYEYSQVGPGGKRKVQMMHPKIGAGLRCRQYTDRVPVIFVPGQTLEQWREAAPALASAFRARSCRVKSSAPGAAVLEFGHGDPLAEPIPALSVPEPPNLSALPIGRTDTGDPWRLGLLGSHLLIAGTTGAGKGSVLWGLVRALSAGIRDGWVQLRAIDPKGGMELALGAALFARFAYASIEDMIELLEDTVCEMDARAVRLWGATRQHTPTVDEPLVIILIDELLTLTSYGVDTAAKKRVQAALGALLSKGRAVGFLVVGAVQDPRKEALPFRDLFPARVALRLRERESADLVLGAGAREAGAVCDDIAISTPGVGYVIGEGSPDPVRVRAAYVSDADIAAMVAGYHPPTMLEVALGTAATS
jgi:S-DNA-T family DNA segregation ATPase FtsK/SpoIIIE